MFDWYVFGAFVGYLALMLGIVFFTFYTASGFVLAFAATVAVSLLTKEPAPEITAEFDSVANG